MKTKAILLLAVLCAMHSASCYGGSLGGTSTNKGIVLTVESDLGVVLTHETWASEGHGWGVAYWVSPAPEVNFLAESINKIGFDVGEALGPSTKTWVEIRGIPSIALNQYNWIYDPNFGGIRFERVNNTSANQFTDRLSLLLGFRLHADDGPHHGWVQFARAQTNPECAFEYVTHAVHPLPGEPIRAGVAPQPELAWEQTPEGEVRLTWPTGFTGFSLQYTTNLAPPVVWQPAPGGDVPGVLLSVPEGGAFFRLTRP